ncbi:MAG: DUF4270 domain-containing protein [Dysgonomonas sp.]
MNFRTFLYGLAVAFAIAFTSCDDDLNSIGQGMQPPSDTIGIQVDSVYLTARTISLQDSVYSTTIYGLLGKYEDDVFGSVKADYMCQFFCPDSTKFHDSFFQLDSARFVIDFTTYSGDTITPMGLKVYELNKPLTGNYYTNVDPTKFYNTNAAPIARTAFSIAGVPYYSGSTTQKVLKADLGMAFAQRFYDAYKSSNNPFTNASKFNEFFKGVYVTTDLGSGALIQVLYSSIDIYYLYTDSMGNYNNTADTVRTGVFTLSVTPEVYQLNKIQNTIPSGLLASGTGASYIKSPAGVCTELTLPIQEIMNKMKDANGVVDTTKIVNLASLTLTGYTEKENIGSKTPPRVPNLLLLDRDSIKSFFEGKKLTDGKTSATTSISSNNTFVFSNLNSIVSYYVKKYYAEGITTDPKFVLLPVDIVTSTSTSSSTSYTTITGIYNYMKPATSILRIDPDNLKMKISFYKF